MRQQLLGYLLGALDAPEQARVEQQIQRDPRLQQELEEIDSSLEPLRQQPQSPDPPEGLAQRTCEFVQREVERRHTTLASAAYSAAARTSGGGRRRWSMPDIIVAGGVIAAMALLFFPAIATSRYQSGITGCQDNLRLLQIALMQYADANYGNFPAVPTEGNLSFAGLYVPLLYHGGYAQNPRLFLCPANNRPNLLDSNDIPTLDQLDGQQGRALVRLQRRSGMDYAYNLGFIINGTYHGIRPKNRGTSAVIGDAPSIPLAGLQRSNHGGRGQNVLYVDGHVAFLKTCEANCDNVYLSDRNLVEAGRHWEDDVLGYSTASPVLIRTNLSTLSTDHN